MSTLFAPFFQQVDSNGAPLSGAKLYFYQTGTSTPLDTYTSSTLTTPNANPVVADSNGRWGAIYLGTSSDYKVILKDSSDVTIATADPVFASATTGRATVNDVAYTATVNDRLIAYTALTASRTITLPAASDFPAGTPLTIIDEAGGAKASVTLSIAPNGTDTINGANSTTVVVEIAYGSAQIESNGVAKWTIIAKSAGGRTAVADAAYAVVSTDHAVVYTSLSAARTVTLPAATTFPVGGRLVVMDGSGSASETNKLSLAPNGTDTIAGSNTTQVGVNIPHGSCVLICNGSTGWDVEKWSVEYVNALGSDQAIGVANTYVDGPSVAQGTVGRWIGEGGVVVAGQTGGTVVRVKLWDGTTVIASREVIAPSSGSAQVSVELSGAISSPAGNIRISATNTSATNGSIKFNQSGNSKDSVITVRRTA